LGVRDPAPNIPANPHIRKYTRSEHRRRKPRRTIGKSPFRGVKADCNPALPAAARWMPAPRGIWRRTARLEQLSSVRYGTVVPLALTLSISLALCHHPLPWVAIARC
jgi:hypothetical protein